MPSFPMESCEHWQKTLLHFQRQGRSFLHTFIDTLLQPCERAPQLLRDPKSDFGGEKYVNDYNTVIVLFKVLV